MKAGFFAALTLILTACVQAPTPEHKLIEWGWDTPRLQHIEAVLPAAQNLPFDGMVIDVETPLDGRGISWTLFGDKPIDEETLDTLADDYAKLNWGRLTDNFLRLTVFPANVGWFEDWSTMEANATAWARLARQLGFAGIMLDSSTRKYAFSSMPLRPIRKAGLSMTTRSKLPSAASASWMRSKAASPG